MKQVFVHLILLAGLCISYSCQGQHKSRIPVWGDWQVWGDEGNGMYANPVLPGDFSDIDCIRVGDDYYGVSSTFQYSPGFVILHSKDLVNWQILGHVVDDLNNVSADLNWDRMNKYGRGIWAGAIRYHDHKFWVYFCDPDKGYFMSTATNPEGPWEPPHQVLAAKGWDDGCPFWDDNGDGYFIGTHFSDGYKIHLFRMTKDGRSLITSSDKVIYQARGSEANKLYKINGIYYHFFSEVKAGGRAVMMERSKNIWGPYEGPKQLSYAQKQFHEPNQGAIIQAVNGNWYFLTHHGTGGDWAGRVLSLLPVNWRSGWPILGSPDKDTIGRMVWQGKMPVKNSKIVLPLTNDEFNESKLNPAWEWNYQPRLDKWSLTQRLGWLRLHSFRPLESGNFFKAGNTLTQRVYRTRKNVVTIKMDIQSMSAGQWAGLAHFGYPNYAAIGVVSDTTGKHLLFKNNEVSIKGIQLTGKDLWLKSTWGLDGRNQFYYSLDGHNFSPFGAVYQLKWGAYRGDRIAIFNYNEQADAGYVDIDYFHYEYSK